MSTRLLSLRTLVCVLFLACLVAAPATLAEADYVAYAQTEKGDLPLPEDLNEVDDLWTIRVEWGSYDGPKARLGVLGVENSSKASSWSMTGPNGEQYSWDIERGDQVPVQGIEAMIQDVLLQTDRFRIVNRADLGDVMREQDLAASGRISKPSGAKTGKILGAQVLMKAVINAYEPKYDSKGVGLGGITGGLLGGARIGKEKSMVQVTFQLIDAETSEVTYSKQVEVVVGKTGFVGGGAGWGGGGALGGFVSGYSKTPIGQAMIAAINQGVFELVKQIGSSKDEGSVVTVKDGEVYINMGADRVQVGDTLSLFAVGEELIDPDTGISLGAEEELMGKIRVTETKEKYSLATPVDIDLGNIQAKDRIVLDREPEPLKFASSWDNPRKRDFIKGN